MLARLAVCSLLVAAALPAVDFVADIEPIFHQRCFACHGPSMQMSDFRLDDREAALKGGYSGAVIVPGDAGASKLIERVSSDKQNFQMPPAGPRLSEAEVAALRAWIDEGAKWPERAPTKKLTQEQRSRHWSFQPIQRPAPPKVDDSSWARNPIDLFVLAKLEAEGVKPSPEADKVTLLRRISFDLVGLPPTPEQVERFLADDSPQAYEKVVDELLDSKHYGERWAIPWLDAARYADSDGYERDPIRPYAWRWRQWAIGAINQDMPFDEFTVEQIAGDLLPGATLEQRVATGFLRNGIKNREAGVKNEEKRFEETLDRTATIGKVWLGLTVGCAQCHDHKYDPISQKELYQLYAFFNNAVERDIDAPVQGELGVLLRALPEYRRRRAEILKEADVEPHYQQWRKEMIEAMDHPGERTDWDFSLTEWRASMDRADWLMRASDDELSEIEREGRVDKFLARLGPDISKQEELAKKLKETKEKLDALEKEVFPVRTLAYTMIERDAAHREPTYIALRGDWRAPGVEVQPLTPAVLPAMEQSDPKHPRLELARWLVDPKNPLTARVTVNRWWQELFGKGLVSTADDFGTQGAPPTHPELLDWLASELVRKDWSRKAMLRLMVTSAAYRQASHDRPDLRDRDPDNKWLARQNRLRLPAELVRDNALAVSGLLNPEIGGPSVHPPQPAGVSELGYAKKAWPEDQGPERYRRGLYIFFQRTTPYPFLTNFDATDTLTSKVTRERSNTPLQALNVLNDRVFLEAAQALALQTVLDRQGFDARLDEMFLRALSRKPEASERDRVATYLAKQKEILAAEPGAAEKLAPLVPSDEDPLEMAAWTGVARGLLNLDEMMVRE
ncbi:MAG: DUF1553 domain-containing protein [Acidobacteria bacterium]|nr:DUF1553 domain-containing protein [Acidobacteriota bacterium]